MPDFLVAVQYVDGAFVEGNIAHWPAAFPQRPIARLWVRRPRGAQWEVAGHSRFAVVPGDPVEVFTVDARDGQVTGDRWRFYADRPPEIDVIDEVAGSPRLPPASAFVPSIAFTAAASDRAPAWIGNFPKALWHRWRARRRR